MACIRRKALHAALALLVPAAAFGQAASKAKSPPTLGIVEELRVPLPDARAQRGSALLVGADGRMISIPLWGGEMVAFDAERAGAYAGTSTSLPMLMMFCTLARLNREVSPITGIRARFSS